MEHIFCTADIAIQGDRVLRFVNCTQERAIYEVIGFSDPSITIIDYRLNGLKAIHELLKTDAKANFASKFNAPANIELQYDHNGNILIELNDIGNNHPDRMLWIVIGLQDSIPVYNYLVERIAPLGDGTFAFAALFNIPVFDLKTNGYSEGFLGCE
jgi:hypothetical protein